MHVTSPQAKATCAGIIAICTALMTVGLVMIASASASLDRPVLQLEFWRTPFGRQLVFVAAGFITILAAAALGRRAVNWNRRTWAFVAALAFAVTTVTLVAVLVPGIGKEVNGARRWIPFGSDGLGLRLQPSEAAKLALVVILAVLLSRERHRVRSFWRTLLPCVAVIAVFVGLVGREDFGTAALLAVIGGSMLLVGGCRIYQLVLLTVPAIAAMVHLVVSHPYRIERLIAFRNIWADPQGIGYHPIQSLVTIASGGWFGRGLGVGVQKYGYLPESRTDFIFSVICEETGIIGGAVVILLFVVLLWLGGRAITHAPNPLARLIAFGVTVAITMQAVMNVAVVTVCMPTKGIALPFVSAGGSGIVFLGAAVGLLAAVAVLGTREEAAAASGPALMPAAVVVS
jgi:cell division protein FtsW